MIPISTNKMGGFNIRDIVDPTRFRSHRLSLTRKSTSSVTINQLPPELLAHVFSFLTVKDLISVNAVCKTFHSASHIDKIWQIRSLKDYGVKLQPGSHLTYAQLYTKVLHKYGGLLGLWQADITHYGGLVQVMFQKDKIVGLEWLAPKNPNYMDPLRHQLLFTVHISDEGETQVLCHRGYHGAHKCQIIQRAKIFSSKCCNPESHRHPQGKEQEFQEWIREETNNAPLIDSISEELLFTKFLNIKQYENSYNFRPLQMPAPRPKAIIQPGIFKGTYGGHGVELILLTYDNDGYAVKATKLLGDPNVPAKQITFRVDLHYSMVLDEYQQRSIDELSKLPHSSSPTMPENLPVQQFYVPTDCLDRGFQTPRQCKARFHGFGQVAGHGFTNSSYTRGHWIVFNEDLFGFLWLELCSFSMFQRIQENITQKF